MILTWVWIIIVIHIIFDLLLFTQYIGFLQILNSKCIVWKVASSEFLVKIKIANLKNRTKPRAEVTPISNDYQTFWRGQYELCPFVDWNYSLAIKNVNYSLVFTLYSYIYTLYLFSFLRSFLWYLSGIL